MATAMFRARGVKAGGVLATAAEALMFLRRDSAMETGCTWLQDSSPIVLMALYCSNRSPLQRTALLVVPLPTVRQGLYARKKRLTLAWSAVEAVFTEGRDGAR
jgi:hypothetical protein